MAAAQAIDVRPRKPTASQDPREGIGSLSRSRQNYESLSNVSQNGCFEFDRVIRSGYLEKRTKTKVGKTPEL